MSSTPTSDPVIDTMHEVARDLIRATEGHGFDKEEQTHMLGLMLVAEIRLLRRVMEADGVAMTSDPGVLQVLEKLKRELAGKPERRPE